MGHLGHRQTLVGSRVVCQDCRVAVGDISELRQIVHDVAPDPGFLMKCPTCGDMIHGPSCPRCNWGVWNRTEDATAEHPSDPTRDVKPAIQAARHHPGSVWVQTIPEARWQVPRSDAQ